MRLFKIENNLKMLKKEYAYTAIDAELELHRYIVEDNIVITLDFLTKDCTITNLETSVTKNFKSEKGIINELWRMN